MAVFVFNLLTGNTFWSVGTNQAMTVHGQIPAAAGYRLVRRHNDDAGGALVQAVARRGRRRNRGACGACGRRAKLLSHSRESNLID